MSSFIVKPNSTVDHGKYLYFQYYGVASDGTFREAGDTVDKKEHSTGADWLVPNAAQAERNIDNGEIVDYLELLAAGEFADDEELKAQVYDLESLPARHQVLAETISQHVAEIFLASIAATAQELEALRAGKITSGKAKSNIGKIYRDLDDKIVAVITGPLEKATDEIETAMDIIING